MDDVSHTNDRSYVIHEKIEQRKIHPVILRGWIFGFRELFFACDGFGNDGQALGYGLGSESALASVF